MTMRGDRRQAGFSLIELLTALLIMSVALAGVCSLLEAQLRQVSRQEADVERRQEGRAVAGMLLRELQQAGFPVVPDRACHAMAGAVEVTPSSVTFLADLYGVATALSAPAAIGDTTLQIPADAQIRDQGLPASAGSAFSANDIIYIYDPGRVDDPDDDRLECHALARAGRSGRLSLAAGDAVRAPFPAGARVELINQVRYAYVPKNGELTRAVNGSVQAVTDGVSAAVFSDVAGQVSAGLTLTSGTAAAATEWRVQAAPHNGFDG